MEMIFVSPASLLYPYAVDKTEIVKNLNFSLNVSDPGRWAVDPCVLYYVLTGRLAPTMIRRYLRDEVR